MTATIVEDAESCGVTVPLAHARGASVPSTVPWRSTVELGEVGELIVRIIEATAGNPAWRDRVQLAKGFAEDVARMLAELDGQTANSRRSRS